jgi:hypothetical protein
MNRVFKSLKSWIRRRRLNRLKRKAIAFRERMRQTHAEEQLQAWVRDIREELDEIDWHIRNGG